VVEIFEQEVLAQYESPRLQGWLPPLLRANGVQELTVTLDDALLFHYQEAGRDRHSDALQEVRYAGARYPTLHMRFLIQPALSQLDRLYAPLSSLGLVCWPSAGVVGRAALAAAPVAGWLSSWRAGGSTSCAVNWGSCGTTSSWSGPAAPVRP
jgi:hypothetical protein